MYDSKPLIYRSGLLYFPLVAWILGIFVFSGITWIIPLYICFAYAILWLTVRSVNRFWRDPLNPVFLVLVLGLIRFSIPGFLSLWSEPDLLIFEMMGLRSETWILGHALALVGLLGVVIGWQMPVQLPGRRLLATSGIFRIRRCNAVSYAAIAGICVGLAALLVFVKSHGGIVEAVDTGEMRSTEIQEGTGKFFYLSLMLISSSVVFSAYLIRNRSAWWITSLPPIFAASCFWVLGGRSRAFVPVACVALVLWYRRDELKVPVKTLLALTLVLLPVLSYVGLAYRGGEGISAFSEIFSAARLAEYFHYALWIDWGHLHALAGAIAAGPGSLGGQTFSYNLLWPLSKFLDLPGKSAGTFIVQTLLGQSERTWGFHATLIGDAYLNYGFTGVLLVSASFGMVLKLIYSAFRRGHIDGCYYSLAAIYCLRIFYESVEKFGEMLVVLTFAFAIIRLGETVFNISRTKTSTELLPA